MRRYCARMQSAVDVETRVAGHSRYFVSPAPSDVWQPAAQKGDGVAGRGGAGAAPSRGGSRGLLPAGTAPGPQGGRKEGQIAQQEIA